MIRRDGSAVEQTVGQWILISQVDHAHLAGKLAEHWGGPGFAPLDPHDELLWAITHHDDGWSPWEQAPDVDPNTGQPRQFVEMELVDSLEIWSGSIDAAARHDPLSGHLVAMHFAVLARLSAPWRKRHPNWPLVEEFLAKYDRLSQDWLQAWQAVNPVQNTPQRADRAYAHLRMFDNLSLWFCCAPAECTEIVETPGGGDVTLVPTDPRHIRVTPWPFTVESLNLEVSGRAVPIRRYADRAELAAAPAQPVTLRWQLTRDAPNR